MRIRLNTGACDTLNRSQFDQTGRRTTRTRTRNRWLQGAADQSHTYKQYNLAVVACYSQKTECLLWLVMVSLNSLYLGICAETVCPTSSLCVSGFAVENVKFIAALGSLLVLDHLLKIAFSFMGWTFPPALAGMFILVAMLSILQGKLHPSFKREFCPIALHISYSSNAQEKRALNSVQVISQELNLFCS